MLKIAIDFDGVLFPSMEKAIELYNKKYNASLDTSQITAYSLHDCLDADVADELLDLFVDKSVYDCLIPYKGAIRAVKTLVEQGCEVYVATASDIKNMEWKEELLQKHFPFIPKDNLIRIYNKSLLNVDVLIEDNLDNLKSTFADRVCLNQPWNVDSDADYVYSIYRVHHWGEINNIINTIERKNKEWEK